MPTGVLNGMLVKICLQDKKEKVSNLKLLVVIKGMIPEVLLVCLRRERLRRMYLKISEEKAALPLIVEPPVIVDTP